MHLLTNVRCLPHVVQLHPLHVDAGVAFQHLQAHVTVNTGVSAVCRIIVHVQE